ncbi:MAG: 50S ribosomal protein L28 [Pseudothermotoga sp.]
MARRCEICGKEPVAGKNVSHSNRHTPRMFRPNLQRVRVILEDGSIKTMKVCTKCLKAGKVRKVAAV